MRKKTPKHNARSNSGRLGEILGILTRRGIVKGITPQKLRAIIEDLGPTFVKLGQILSMRRDMLPAEYCKELEGLRAEVRPMPFDEVRQVIENEYGKPLPTVFAEFDPEPLGAASIAQAHTARLQNGRRVVVKVQRPGIRETMAQDVALLHKAAGLLGFTELGEVVDLNMVLDEMWSAAQQEMDFLTEAQNADAFRQLNREVAYVDCPLIEHEHTTERVLVMEYIDGIPIDEVETLAAEEYDLDEIGLKLADNYVKQIIEDGFFHADPHPGNLRIRDGKIVWIDLGMMGRLSPRDQTLLRDGVQAIVRGDVDALKTVVLSMGVYTERIDHVKLYTDIDDFLSKYGKMEIGSIDLGQLFEEIMALAKTHHISMPGGISMLGRGVLTLEGVLAVISPEINLVQIMANRMSANFLRDFDWKHTLKSGARKLYESGSKAIELPAQLSDLLRMGIKGQARINLKLTDCEQPLSSLDRMVNKLVKCILCAALLIGSCMICNTDMRPKLLDIPLLGLLGFIAALVMGAWVLWDMHKDKK